MKDYFLNILIAADQFLNSVLGGYPDETISLRLAIAKHDGESVGCVLCYLLGLIVKNHCDNVLANEHQSIIDRKL